MGERHRRLLAPVGALIQVDTVAGALEAIARQTIDVVICTYPFEGTIGLEILDDLYAAAPGVPSVVITDHPGDVRGDPRSARPAALLPLTDLEPRVLLESVSTAILHAERQRSVAASRQHRAILDGIDGGVMLVSTTGRIIAGNEMATSIFGLTASDRDVHTVWELPGALADGRDASRRRHPVWCAVERNARVAAVLEIVRPIDQVRRRVELVAQPLAADDELRPYAVVLTVRDVTERHAAESARHQVERRELVLSSHATDGYLILDADGRILDASPTAIWGHRSVPIIGSRAIGLLDPTDRPAFTAAFVASSEQPSGPVRARVAFVDEDGARRTVDATLTNWMGEPSIGGIVVNLRDVTELATIEKQQLNGTGFELTFDHSSIGMAVLDPSLRVVRANESLLSLLDRRVGTVVGSALPDIVHPADRDRCRSELQSIADGRVGPSHTSQRFVSTNGEVVWATLDVVLVRDANSEPRHLIVQFQDTTERRRSEEALEHQRVHDSVTGLPNIRLVHKRLSSAIEQIDSPSTGVAVAHLMIDRFQGVVDTFGYDPGDDLLRQIAGRLASGRRRTDTVARIGRADFIIVSQQNDRAAAAALGEQLIRRFDTPFRLLDQEIRLTASVGVVLVNESGSVGGALRDAEATVNKAKAFGGDRAELFEAQLRHQAAHRFGLEQTLSRAIENDDLRVVYQPILDLSTRSLVGFESLLRWNSPEEEALPATKIIEIAESTGQIARIGEFVLSEALAQVTRARLAAGAGSKLWVAVNLSTREFAITDPVERCASMLAESGVPVDALRFELTETAVMEDVEEAIAQLARLRDLGVKVALDDFGTGHSSLAYLSRLPVSSLKIDHSFVWSLTNAAGDLAILEAIVAMGKSLGIELCAEGIETDAQLAILERLGCDRGQGFLFSMPLEPDELLAYVAAGIAYAPNSEP